VTACGWCSESPVDPTRRLLWAVSTAEPVMERYSMVDENATGVFAFDIQTGALAHKYVLP
jgi:hypothetical protein